MAQGKRIMEQKCPVKESREAESRTFRFSLLSGFETFYSVSRLTVRTGDWDQRTTFSVVLPNRT